MGRKKNVFFCFQAKWVSILALFFYSTSLLQFGFSSPAAAENRTFPSQLGGNFRHQQKDILIPTPAFPLSLVRTYNSQSQFKGIFGYGWHSEYDVKVVIAPDAGGGYVVEADGTVLIFHYDPKRKVYFSKQSGWQTIERESNKGYVRSMKGGRFQYFDEQGRLKRIYDLSGNELVLNYSQEGRLTKVRTSIGQSLLFHYDPVGNVRRVEDPLGRSYSYRIDGRGDLTQVVDPMGRATNYQYDRFHNLAGIRFPDGGTKTLSYDTDRDLLLKEVGPGSVLNAYSYDFDTRTTCITNGEGKKTYIRHEDNFRRKVITDALKGETVLNYENGLLVLHRDQVGNEIQYEYDNYGNMTVRIDALGYRTRFEYHPTLHLPVAIINPLGQRNELRYDEKGNLIQVVSPAGDEERYAYTSNGSLREYVNAMGHKTQYQYDRNGYLTKIFDSLGVILEVQYDAAGQMRKRIHPDGTSISYQYNPVGQVVAVTDSGNRTTRFAYDPLDRIISIIDPEGHRNHFTYNLAGLPTAHKDPLGYETLFGYDATGNLTKITDARGNITQYHHDSLGRLIGKINAAGYRFKNEYDAAGRLVAVTDAKGQTIRYRYNGTGRVVEKRYPDNSSIHFNYDPAGQLTGMQGPSGSSFFTYDSCYRLVSRHDTHAGQTLYYRYNGAGQLVERVGPDGQNFQYVYDGRGNPLTIIDPLGGNTEYKYDAANRRSLVKYPNGTISHFTYDRLGRLSQVQHEFKDRKSMTGIEYAYDQRDNRVSVKIDRTILRTYAYDPMGQLIKENTEDGKSILYSYDGLGNRLEVKGKIQELYLHDSLNRLIKAGQEQYAYDENGNLIRKASGKEVVQYQYDADRILTRVHLPEGTYHYLYDAFGNRISRTGPEGKTSYLYDKEDVLAEFSDNRKLERTYIHGPGIDDISGFIVGKEYFAVHTDGLGSVVALTNSKQEIVSRYDYSAFGEKKAIQERIAMPFLFTGARYDKESGLYYLRSRAYDPRVGRFISPDVIDIAGGINLYRYVNNNPLNRTDPYGEIAPILAAALIGLGISGVVGGIGGYWREGTRRGAWAGFAGGAVSGVIGGAAIAYVVLAGAPSAIIVGAGIASGAVGSGSGSIVEQYINVSKVDWSQVGISAFLGGFFGILGGISTAATTGLERAIISSRIVDEAVKAVQRNALIQSLTSLGLKDAIMSFFTEIPEEYFSTAMDTTEKDRIKRVKVAKAKDLERLLEEANDLKVRQNKAIGEAKDGLDRAQEASDRIKMYKIDGEPDKLCQECQLKVTTLLSITGEINSYKDPLIGNRDIAKGRTAQVCKNPKQKGVIQLVESVESAAVLATNQAKAIDGLAKKSKNLEVEINNCISNIQNYNNTMNNSQSSLADLSRIENEIETWVYHSRDASSQVKKCKDWSEGLRRSLEAKISEIKSEGIDPKEDPIARYDTIIRNVLGGISSNANKGDNFVLIADSTLQSARVEIKTLKAKIDRLKPCNIKFPPAGLAADHEATAITAALFASDARAQADEARRCLKQPTSQRIPRLVSRSTVDTGATRPQQFDPTKDYKFLIILAPWIEIKCQVGSTTTAISKVLDTSRVQVTVVQDGFEYSFSKDAARDLLVAKGFFVYKPEACGYVPTDKFKNFGPGITLGVGSPSVPKRSRSECILKFCPMCKGTMLLGTPAAGSECDRCIKANQTNIDRCVNE